MGVSRAIAVRGQKSQNQSNWWEVAVNLAKMSIPKLKKLQKAVNEALANSEDRDKKQARTELEAKARELGFKLTDLVGNKQASKSAQAPAYTKFHNPADADETWSGRGRRPKWFNAAIASGKTPHELAV
jgi:DNA-binding protein H-NS